MAVRDEGSSSSAASQPPLRFVLCADDFGLSAGVSEAILALLALRRISATSAMSSRAGWPMTAARLRDFAASADLGVHLNLTCGSALGVMSRFAPSGELPPLRRVLRWALWGRLPLTEIADEFRRQIDSFAHHLGREPDFLDGHQHVHALPGIRDALIAAVEGLGLKRRLYVRDPADRPAAIVKRGVGVPKAMLIARLSRGFGAKLAEAGLLANTSFAGIAPFNTRRDYAADFTRFLLAPGARHLVMCHPGFVDAELAAADPVCSTRPLEYAFLAGEGYEALLANHGARVARMRDLG